MHSPPTSSQPPLLRIDSSPASTAPTASTGTGTPTGATATATNGATGGRCSIIRPSVTAHLLAATTNPANAPTGGGVTRTATGTIVMDGTSGSRPTVSAAATLQSQQPPPLPIDCVLVFELMKRANLVRGLHPCVLRIDFQELVVTLSDPNNAAQDKRFRTWHAAMLSRIDKDTEDGTKISMVIDGLKRELATLVFQCVNTLERQYLYEALSYVTRKSFTAPYATFNSIPASLCPTSTSPLPLLPFPMEDKDASLRVLICTLNMGKAPLWNHQCDWLPVEGSHKEGYDIIAFGVQECTMNDADLISILTVRIGAFAAQASAANGANYSAPAPTSYRLLYSHTMWEIREYVFVATRWLPFIRNVECDTVKTGFGDVIANKGGIGIAFSVFDTPLCFINCHLAAHQNEVKNRNRDAQLIGSQLKLHHSKHSFCCTDTYNQFAVLFWFGDLNYRCVGTLCRLFGLKHTGKDGF